MKTGEKGETGVHRGRTDVEHHHINVVYQYDPLKLKNEVTNTQGLSSEEIHQVLFNNTINW